jgi:type VI secretion system secreted protein VgrG
MPVTQSSRNLAINTPLGEDKVLIVRASINEQLGRLFQMEVELASDNPNLDFSSVVGGNATIRLDLPDSKTPRFFNGFVSRFVQTDASTNSGRYHATLVPWLWFLTRTADCRIFQTKSVPDIIKQVFRDHGFTDFRDALSAEHTPWDYCVQYRETDFNFVSRLMQHEGIYYFFEQANGKHTLVFADGRSAHKPFPGYDKIPYRGGRTAYTNAEAITSWTLEQAVQPGTYALNDFNFEKPKTSLLAHSNVVTRNAQSNFAIYDYPGEYGEHADGSDYAKIRIEELHTQQEVVHGNGNAHGLAVGCLFSLTNSPRRDQNRKYLITSASYQLSADSYTGSGNAGNEEALFSCSFTALDAAKPFRSARITPKPLIQGPQTAIVVGPSGEEIHTDKYGRVKVQFHWDRYGKADENSSCWVRISQAAWAGKKWGAMCLPRVGQEVIVEHLEGDPDLPIITGQVYNADTMPPYDLPANKTRTTFKTSSTKGGGGFNELRFEDKKGSEQIFVHAEKDQEIQVKNDRKEEIGGYRHLVVKKDKLERVFGERHERVGKSHYEKIRKHRHVTVSGDDAVLVSGKKSLTVKGDVVEVFQGNHSEQATNSFYLKATNIVIEASENVTIKVGGSSIAIEADGIGLQTGGQVKIQAGSIVTVNGAMVTIN